MQVLPAMANWKEVALNTKKYIKCKKFHEAKLVICNALTTDPHNFNLLIVATNVYRASDEREESLKFAELLIKHYPGNWNGYGRAAQDLLELKRFEEARRKIKEGLQKFPDQINLLIIAINICRASGNAEKSLKYSKKLITYYPNNWNGYVSSIQNLITLKRLEEAKQKLREGLEKFPIRFISRDCHQFLS